jgi:hypothetical protein
MARSTGGGVAMRRAHVQITGKCASVARSSCGDSKMSIGVVTIPPPPPPN